MCSTSSSTATASQRGMFDVQNIYGTPQVPRKKPVQAARPRRMTLIDLRNVPLTEEDAPQRKASSGTIRSEGGLSHYSKSGIWHIHDSTDSLQSAHRSSMRTKHTSGGSQDGSTRFPKLEECAHFHYDFVDFGPLQVTLCDHDQENYRHNEEEKGGATVLVRVTCSNKAWTVRRTLSHFASLDRQLHRCIFDRKFSQLPELQLSNMGVKNSQEVEQLFQGYLRRFTELAGTMINCGSILNWLEMDNRGNRLLAVDDSGINTPAIAAAHAIKRYNAQAADEISLQVGDIVSVIDMPPAEDTIWWRGKRGFEVGFFPSECVEVIGDKVPPSMATCMPATGSLSSSPGNMLTPISTPATARKPCEIDSAEDSASMMRKHGKLMSFLRTFFSTRPPRNQLKQSGIVKERVFGCDLGEHLLNSGHDVPLVLKSCTEVIERYGIVDGIYRLSGITSNIQKLRVAFDEDMVPELMESTYLQDIHSISSLLKMYFRELPNPLLTYQLYDKFAEAVKDEDNKLLRIHDVVQQLPPPHYRTLEYLMKHLGRVASHAFETGMHSKNLAIVWAPNLLRSKELELGGGAAALQGVGIQAVVTECLICYCDLIFNDKMPSYNSPHLHKSQKKPRPKSLAISTPTRLLSLEEARERAFIGSLAHSQRFIDVGGGPSSLPSTYHTVIDLPGYRKKANKDTNKGKKSPVSGWKSIFSKPRGGSVKKGRKGSEPGEDKPLGSVQAKALTEEDVHNWKRKLRTAKSAESLLSMTTSARSSISSQTSSSMSHTEGYRQKEELLSPYHKRSLSSDATAIIHHYHRTSPNLQSVSSPSSWPPGELSPESQQTSPGSSHQSRIDLRRADQQPPRKQSFVRGDSTRKAMHHHRRTPSAPNTPRLDRDRNTTAGGGTSAAHATVNGQHKSSSQPHLDSLPASSSSDSSLLTSPTDTSLGIDIDAAIKARLQQMALQSRGARSSDSGSPRSPEKQHAGPEKRKSEMGNGVVVQLQSSPGSHRRHVAGGSDGEPGAATSPVVGRSKFFVSRYHDYAEILSDDEGGVGGGRVVSGCYGSAPSSTSDMQDLVDKLDSKLSSAGASFYLRAGSEDSSEPEPKLAKLERDRGDNSYHPHPKGGNSASASPNKRLIPASSSGGSSESLPSTQVVRRRAQWIPSDSAERAAGGSGGERVEFPELVPRSSSRDAALPPIPHNRNRNAAVIGGQQQRLSPLHHQQPGVGGSMSKCLSVPSDIARSLENVTASHSDLLSSVTISELSQSINSFCTGAGQDGDSPTGRAGGGGGRDDPRWRRSASLDSLEAESSMCRTLRAINAQMDSAFHEKVERAVQLEEAGYSRHGQEGSPSSLTPLHISEDNLAMQPAMQETHFPATSDASLKSPKASGYCSSPSSSPKLRSGAAAQQETIPRSASDSRDAVDREGEDAMSTGAGAGAMSQSYPVPDYATVKARPRKTRSKRDGCVDFEADFPDYAVITKRPPPPASGGDGGGGSSSSNRGVGGVSGGGDGGGWTQPSDFSERPNFCEDRLPGRIMYSPTEFQPPPSPVLQSASAEHVATQRGSPSAAVRGSAAAATTAGAVVPPADSRTEERAGGRSDNSATSSSNTSTPKLPHGRVVSGGSADSCGVATPGVCVVRRQRHSSSSSSSSSSDGDGNNSDDSIEIVHHAQPLDAQFAMKLRSRQRAAESLPLPSSPVSAHPPAALPPPPEIPPAPPAQPQCPPVPGDLRQFSPDDVMWRQSPLFGRSAEGYGSGQEDGQFGLSSPPAGKRDNNSKVQQAAASPKRTGRPRTASSDSDREFVQPAPMSPKVSQGRQGGVELQQTDPSSPSRRKAASKSAAKGGGSRLQHHEVPIISGNLRTGGGSGGGGSAAGGESQHASTPASQQTHLPCPQSLTISGPSPSPQTVLTSPRSPTISSAHHQHHHPHHHHSRIPSPRSPTSPSPGVSSPQSPRGVSSPQSPRGTAGSPGSSSPGVPLHLMLYHPDEFQVPPAAVGVANECSSLPQVHVQSDTVTEEKAVIRKGRGRSSSTGGVVVPQPQQHVWANPADAGVPSSEGGGMQLGKAEQDSMEVDNLCNRLVDELHNVGSGSGSQPSSDLDLDPESSSAPLSPPARGSLQVEAVVKRSVEETDVGGEAIVEQRLVRVESFGQVQEEEMENALNVGKEMLLAHSATAAASSAGSDITTTTTTTTVSSGSSHQQQQRHTQSSPTAKPSSSSTHERRPSASRIPRFHKRTDSREEKVSEVTSQGEAASPHTSDTSRSGLKSRDGAEHGRSLAEQGSKPATQRTSKIPLSQKIPSPTGSFREPKISKTLTSPSSPRPSSSSASTPSSAGAGAGKPPSQGGKSQPSPVPRTRTSIHKSEHVAPPSEEVVEVARPSVKKRTSLNQKGDRNAAAAAAASSAAAAKENRGSKSVIVQELKMDKGDAKLVIEKQPNLKKKIQTVHARKVPHPPRQMAEALDTDTTDSPPATEVSSTGPSDLEHSGMSSQEDEVFSDESLRVGRDRSYSSGMSGSSGGGVRSPRSPRQQHYFYHQPQQQKHQQQQQQQPTSPLQAYQQLAASRSSLDDSALQLAAERYDDLIPWEGAEIGGGYSTGSLRSRRSLKMRNLMEVFERGGTVTPSSGSATATSGSEDGAGSGSEVRFSKCLRSDSASGGSTTISLGSQGSQDKEADTDDDLFQPPSSSCPPRLPASSASRRSRSRERGGRGGGGGGAGGGGGNGSHHTSPPHHRRPSQSPTARRGRGEDSVLLRRRRPSPGNRGNNSVDSERQKPASQASSTSSSRTVTETGAGGGSSGSSSGGGVGFGRPPRYRSASRGRSYSDSSTSESDNTLQYLEAGRGGGGGVLPPDSPSRPRGLPPGSRPSAKPEERDSHSGRQDDRDSSRSGRQEDRDSRSGRGGRCEDRRRDSEGSLDESGSGESVQRQGSIKELRQLFEKSPAEDSGSDLSPTTPVRRSIRTRSVSPAAADPSSSPGPMANVMRRSLEIPSSASSSSAAMLKQRDTPLTSQPLRLGPKPFYGSKK